MRVIAQSLCLIFVGTLGLGCGGDPTPPKVDAATEAEEARQMKEQGERELRNRKGKVPTADPK